MSRRISFGEAVTLVAQREFGQRLRERSFYVSTAITVAVFVVIIVFPRLLSFGIDSYDVGLVGKDTDLRAAASQQADTADVELTLADYDDATSARADVESDDIDAYVADGTVYVKRDLPTQLRVILTNAYADTEGAAALTEAGLDPNVVAGALGSATLDTVTLEADAEERNTRGLIAFIGSLVLFGTLMGYSMWVAMGVVEEKSSRVVEVILAAIPTRALLAGKIIGIGLVGFLQLILIAVLAFGAAAAAGTIEFTAATVAPVLLSLGWFVLAFAAYASLAAAAAARISRQEELSNVTGPLTTLSMASYVAAFFAFMSPASAAVPVLSLIPPISALVMPIRMARGDAAGWEIATSLGLMVALIGVLVWLAARIYDGAVLRMGAKVSLRDALSSSQN